MSQNDQPVIGPRGFQWNVGGWFGTQLGGTAWLAAGAVVLMSHSFAISFVWLACFALANAIGFAFWTRRTVIAPFKAIQFLILVLGLAGLVAWFSLAQFRPDLASLMKATTQMGYFALPIFPAIAGWFYLLERDAKRVQ